MYTIQESKGQGRAEFCCKAPDRQITRPLKKESIVMLVAVIFAHGTCSWPRGLRNKSTWKLMHPVCAGTVKG